MIKIYFNNYSTEHLGAIYKDNYIDIDGLIVEVDIDLNEVTYMYVNFKVGQLSYTNDVSIIDIENNTVSIPITTDVLKEGTHQLELVAVMNNGSVIPSRTYKYLVDKSLENPNAIEADSYYPILMTLIEDITDKIEKANDAVERVDASIENMANELAQYKETTTNALNSDISNYKEAITNELEESFNNYSNNTTSNITRALDNKIVEIDNRVNAKITDVNTSLNNKINEVNEVIEEVELSEQTRKEEHTELVNELSSYSSDINNVRDRVEVLESKITDNEVIVDLKNKVNNHEERITTSEKTIRHQGILLNALNDLDDTITIENEEGTVISLPQSDDGKIIIDELQGNTLVNYCTNGSEELTLNNEINVQGTDVTLTDTVEGGKVDVILEGNTLILGEEGNEVEAGTEGARLVSVGELEDNKIEIISTNSDNILSNEKEISLSEPLRGLPNGVCDKFVKQGGKWYVERNCRELVLDESQGCSISDSNGKYPSILRLWFKSISDLKGYEKILCDKLPVAENKDYPSIYCTNGLDVHLPLSNDTSLEVAKQWLSENPIKVVYTLATPTYEEITNSTLITYLDITHISNNSLIPCNMKVANSGYNTIIKPSTQYTVAFDTDKSGEVNIGLGGAITSTTNNVATITTPNALTDDTLRLYGKGIKISNVRLLEGDKTNYIPQYFEGMKSCFEDNEVKIISRNKNLFTNYEDFINIKGINNICISSSHTEGCSRLDIAFYDNNFNRITDCLVKSGNYFYKINAGELGGCYRLTSNQTQLNTPICVNDKPTYMKLIDGEVKYGYKKYNNIQIEEGTQATSYIPHKSNSIQLQLNEPLRAAGDVKDRFVLKDGKLMIERNCGIGILNGTERWDKHSITDDPSRANVFVGIYWSKAPVNSASSGSLIANNVIPRNDTINPRSFYIVSKSFMLVIDNKELSTRSVEGLKEWLRNNPITYIYKKDEPTYEEIPYETQKLILECFENGTLFIDTLIPPIVSVTYSANKPLVNALNEIQTIQDQQDEMILENAVNLAIMNLTM